MSIQLKIKEIAERGLDRMVSEVQAELGVITGDTASIHFSGGELETRITLGLMDYVIAELSAQMEDLEERVKLTEKVG